MKGIADVRLQSGNIRKAELHGMKPTALAERK